jgi:hypothetical protein
MSEVSSIGVWMLSVGLTTLTAASARAIGESLNRRVRARKAAERAHARSIAEARPGDIVRVTGRLAFAEAPIQAPFSGRACAHFEATVSSRNQQGYKPRASTHRTRSFYLRDDSGQIYIDTDGAIIDIVHDHHWWSRDMEAEERFEMEQCLYQNGPSWSRLLSLKDDLRYSEGALLEGEILTAVGVAVVSRDPERVLYRDGPRRLSVVAPRRGALFVSDSMHF